MLPNPKVRQRKESPDVFLKSPRTAHRHWKVPWYQFYSHDTCPQLQENVTFELEWVRLGSKGTPGFTSKIF